MKKCASELELEAFIRGRGLAAEQKPGSAAAGANGPYGLFSAADLSGAFGFAASVSSSSSIDLLLARVVCRNVAQQRG